MSRCSRLCYQVEDLADRSKEREAMLEERRQQRRLAYVRGDDRLRLEECKEFVKRMDKVTAEIKRSIDSYEDVPLENNTKVAKGIVDGILDNIDETMKNLTATSVFQPFSLVQKYMATLKELRSTGERLMGEIIDYEVAAVKAGTQCTDSRLDLTDKKNLSKASLTKVLSEMVAANYKSSHESITGACQGESKSSEQSMAKADGKKQPSDENIIKTNSKSKQSDQNIRKSKSTQKPSDENIKKIDSKNKQSDENIRKSKSKTKPSDENITRANKKDKKSDQNIENSQKNSSDQNFTEDSHGKAKSPNESLTDARHNQNMLSCKSSTESHQNIKKSSDHRITEALRSKKKPSEVSTIQVPQNKRKTFDQYTHDHPSKTTMPILESPVQREEQTPKPTVNPKFLKTGSADETSCMRPGVILHKDLTQKYAVKKPGKTAGQQVHSSRILDEKIAAIHMRAVPVFKATKRQQTPKSTLHDKTPKNIIKKPPVGNQKYKRSKSAFPKNKYTQEPTAKVKAKLDSDATKSSHCKAGDCNSTARKSDNVPRDVEGIATEQAMPVKHENPKTFNVEHSGSRIRMDKLQPERKAEECIPCASKTPCIAGNLDCPNTKEMPGAYENANAPDDYKVVTNKPCPKDAMVCSKSYVARNGSHTSPERDGIERTMSAVESQSTKKVDPSPIQQIRRKISDEDRSPARQREISPTRAMSCKERTIKASTIRGVSSEQKTSRLPRILRLRPPPSTSRNDKKITKTERSPDVWKSKIPRIRRLCPPSSASRDKGRIDKTPAAREGAPDWRNSRLAGKERRNPDLPISEGTERITNTSTTGGESDGRTGIQHLHPPPSGHEQDTRKMPPTRNLSPDGRKGRQCLPPLNSENGKRIRKTSPPREMLSKKNTRLEQNVKQYPRLAEVWSDARSNKKLPTRELPRDCRKEGQHTLSSTRHEERITRRSNTEEEVPETTATGLEGTGRRYPIPRTENDKDRTTETVNTREVSSDQMSKLTDKDKQHAAPPTARNEDRATDITEASPESKKRRAYSPQPIPQDEKTITKAPVTIEVSSGENKRRQHELSPTSGDGEKISKASHMREDSPERMHLSEEGRSCPLPPTLEDEERTAKTLTRQTDSSCGKKLRQNSLSPSIEGGEIIIETSHIRQKSLEKMNSRLEQAARRHPFPPASGDQERELKIVTAWDVSSELSNGRQSSPNPAPQRDESVSKKPPTREVSPERKDSGIEQEGRKQLPTTRDKVKPIKTSATSKASAHRKKETQHPDPPISKEGCPSTDTDRKVERWLRYSYKYHKSRERSPFRDTYEVDSSKKHSKLLNKDQRFCEEILDAQKRTEYNHSLTGSSTELPVEACPITRLPDIMINCGSHKSNETKMIYFDGGEVGLTTSEPEGRVKVNKSSCCVSANRRLGERTSEEAMSPVHWINNRYPIRAQSARERTRPSGALTIKDNTCKKSNLEQSQTPKQANAGDLYESAGKPDGRPPADLSNRHPSNAPIGNSLQLQDSFEDFSHTPTSEEILDRILEEEKKHSLRLAKLWALRERAVPRKQHAKEVEDQLPKGPSSEEIPPTPSNQPCSLQKQTHPTTSHTHKHASEGRKSDRLPDNTGAKQLANGHETGSVNPQHKKVAAAPSVSTKTPVSQTNIQESCNDQVPQKREDTSEFDEFKEKLPGKDLAQTRRRIKEILEERQKRLAKLKEKNCLPEHIFAVGGAKSRGESPSSSQKFENSERSIRVKISDVVATQTPAENNTTKCSAAVDKMSRRLDRSTANKTDHKRGETPAITNRHSNKENRTGQTKSHTVGDIYSCQTLIGKSSSLFSMAGSCETDDSDSDDSYGDYRRPSVVDIPLQRNGIEEKLVQQSDISLYTFHQNCAPEKLEERNYCDCEPIVETSPVHTEEFKNEPGKIEGSEYSYKCSAGKPDIGGHDSKQCYTQSQDSNKYDYASSRGNSDNTSRDSYTCSHEKFTDFEDIFKKWEDIGLYGYKQACKKSAPKEETHVSKYHPADETGKYNCSSYKQEYKSDNGKSSEMYGTAFRQRCYQGKSTSGQPYRYRDLEQKTYGAKYDPEAGYGAPTATAACVHRISSERPNGKIDMNVRSSRAIYVHPPKKPGASTAPGVSTQPAVSTQPWTSRAPGMSTELGMSTQLGGNSTGFSSSLYQGSACQQPQACGGASKPTETISPEEIEQKLGKPYTDLLQSLQLPTGSSPQDGVTLCKDFRVETTPTADPKVVQKDVYVRFKVRSVRTYNVPASYKC